MPKLVILLALVVLALATLLACEGEGEVSPTPTPLATVTPSPTALPAEGLRLVYKEFGSEIDVIWLAAAADPERRTKIAEVEHAPDMGILAGLSPDGKHIAYLGLAAANQDPERDAQAWVLDVDSGETRRLTEGLDLASTPIWSPDGTSIVVRRNGPEGEIGRAASLLRVAITDGSETPILDAQGVLELFPIGYSPEGDALYFAQITLRGTDFGMAAGGGEARILVHVSDEPARDWHLSPDGSQVVYLARQPTDQRIAIRAFVARLAEGAAPQSLSDLSDALDVGDHFNPVWHPDGKRIAVGRSPVDGARAAALVGLRAEGLEEVKPGPDQGFDVPLAWSPEGNYLAVRSFEGTSAAQPGRGRLVIIELGGGREAVADKGNLEFIGWLSGGSR